MRSCAACRMPRADRCPKHQLKPSTKSEAQKKQECEERFHMSKVDLENPLTHAQVVNKVFKIQVPGAKMTPADVLQLRGYIHGGNSVPVLTVNILAGPNQILPSGWIDNVEDKAINCIMSHQVPEVREREKGEKMRKIVHEGNSSVNFCNSWCEFCLGLRRRLVVSNGR